MLNRTLLNATPISPGIETLTHGASQSGAFPRFGSAVITRAASQLTHDLDPLTRTAHQLYQTLAGDPGKRIIFMDLVGWCGLRTLIDYNRELFYFKDRSHNPEDKPKGNIPAAVERVQREITATLSDVIVAGPLVAHLTHLNDHINKQFTGNFIDPKFLQYLARVSEKLVADMGKNQQPLNADALLKALYQKIGQDMAQGQPEAVQTKISQWFQPEQFKQYLAPETNKVLIGLKKVFGGTKTKFVIEDAENELAKLLGKVGDHSIDIANQSNLTGLLSNMHKLQDKMTRHFSTDKINFADLAKKFEKSKNIRLFLPFTLFGIFLLNLMMPHLIQKNTQKTFGMSTYPGETGLVLPDDAAKANLNYAAHSGQNNHLFPFLSTSFSAGNWWPLLGVAALLPAALGIYRSGKLFSGGKLNLKQGFELPQGLSLKKLRDYGTSWLKAHDFETSFPWAGEQQQATTYANTLVARIATARSPIEFRERLIDSVLSYVAAFEMNGAIDSKIATFLSKAKSQLGQQAQKLMGVSQADLIKKDGSIRSWNEIYSIADPKTRRDTLTVKTWQGWAATLFTTLTMGVFEPILSIFLTSKQADWINARNNRKHYEKTTQAYGSPRLSSPGPAFSAFNQQSV